MINKRKAEVHAFGYAIGICTAKNPIVGFTEKEFQLFKNRQYCFDISSKLTKREFKKVVEHYFGVKLLSIQFIKTRGLMIKSKRIKKMVEEKRESSQGQYWQCIITVKTGVSLFIEPGHFIVIPIQIPIQTLEKDSKNKINFDDILLVWPTKKLFESF